MTPDNGTLTHLKKKVGITAVRMIDETVNRLPRSGESYTFHGRDVYAYTGARLAAGVIEFEEVGPEVSVNSLVEFPLVDSYLSNNRITGIIEILDIRFGNLWTNIPRSIFNQLEVEIGEKVTVEIESGNQQVYAHSMTYGRSFADSSLGEALIYVNSLDNMGIALNQASFAKTYKIGTGSTWEITIVKEK